MLSFTEVHVPEDMARLVQFLRESVWPFHSQPALSAELVERMSFAPPSTRSFWITDDGEPIGLLRLQDLEDVEDGSPILDLRIATARRGQGIGRQAVAFGVTELFGTYPTLPRIEATTREDNIAMQRVLDACGFMLEGRLRKSWPTADGQRLDTFVYGILREEWHPA